MIFFSSTNLARAEKNTAKNTNADYGLPTHRRDGGSRGGNNQCLAGTKHRDLIALIPEKSVGINAAKSPELFFYIPKVKQQQTLEFILRNEQDELIYEAFLTTTGEGIISVEVPVDIQSNLLETEENYHWYLSLICDFQQRSRDIVVEGWLRQSNINLATKQKLTTTNLVEQAALYHQQGFWYDALAILADNHQSANEQEQPIIREKWSELLKSVGLANLAQEPFIETQLIEKNP